MKYTHYKDFTEICHLTVDDLEIRFEKQHPSHASKWCIYIRAKLGEKTKSLLMIKTDKKPYTIFSYDNGRTIAHSQEAKEEIRVIEGKKTKIQKKFTNRCLLPW